MSDKLNENRVQKVLKSCLFTDSELPADGSVPSGAVKVQGIVRSFGFHPERVEAAKPAIAEMLDELPSEFRADGGGGWSFLNGCNDKHGDQWTGMQSDVEQLVALGIAAGYVEYLMPRDMWSILPGGVPYFSTRTPLASPALPRAEQP